MVGRIRDSYANPRWSRGFAQLSRILLTPRVFISGYANTGKKFSIAFIKYFSKLIRQMKGILFIDFLILKDFLNTRSRQWSFLLTNQNAHLITHEPMKFRVTKVKSKFKASASNRVSWKCLWILLNLWEKCLKFGENRGNIQKIYDSVRNFKMNVTALDRSWKGRKLAQFCSPRRWLRSWIAHRALWSFAGLES